MTRQAQVGAFALVAMLLLFGMFYVITDFGTRHTGYRVGIHFQSASGLTSGALVYFSGVNVGTVDSIQLLQDNTVDVILAIRQDIDIPLASRFLIQAPLTGSPNVVIVPPPPSTVPGPLLARSVLPVAQQPQGTNGATIADLLESGQGEVKKLDRMLSLMEARTPKLLDTLQVTLDNANELTLTAKNSMSELSGSLLAATNNIEQLSSTLNSSATVDSRKVGALLDQFGQTSTALNKSMNSLQDVATNPQLKANLLSTMQSIATATQTMAELTQDLRQVTGDPQTQQQLRDTVANLDALMQRSNSLLSELGGTSNVPGVDSHATPYPAIPATSPYPFGTSAPLTASAPTGTSAPIYPYPASTIAPSGVSPVSNAKLQSKLGQIARNLVDVQLRLYGLSSQTSCCLNPTLPNNRGPSGDLNVFVLPNFSTSLMVGASSIGNNTTYNAALLERVGNDAHIGGGVLYSQLGLTGDYGLSHSIFGIQGFLYDPRYPMLDMYGNLRITPAASVFFGQRDIFHQERRNVYGLQYKF